MRRLAAALALALAMPAAGEAVPSRMMANVYRLSEAGAMLHVCRASTAYSALPPENSARIDALERRLAALVGAIATHYGDAGLATTYERTRERLASDPGLRLHVRNNYRSCGEALMSRMESYLGDNEKLIGDWLRREAMKAPAK